jgi:hypothetical protein
MPSKKQTQILTLIDEAKKGYDRHRGEFSLLESIYLNILDPELVKNLKARGKSHIAPQIVRAKVRKVAISVMKTYFENDRFAVVTPEIPDEESIETVDKIQRALDLWTTKRINLYSRFRPSVIDALVYGTPIVKIHWADGLRVSRVKIRDFYIDPNAASIFDIQYAVHRITTTAGRLKAQYGRKFKWKNYIGQHENGKIVTIDIGDASRIEVMEVYRYEGGRWLVSTVLPDQTFIRTDVPLKDGLPFIVGNVEQQFVRIDDSNTVEAYGAPFIEPMAALQEEYTVTRNQQIDAIDTIFNQRFLATKTSGLNEKDLVSRRKKIQVADINEIKELPIPRFDPSIFNIDRLDSEMQEVSGITKYNQGLNDPKNLNQTATGVSILTEEGNAVISDIIRALNESFFEPAIRRMVRLIYKYDTNPILYGIDRNRIPSLHISINAGVGAVNNEILLNNISAAEGTAIQMAQMRFQMQDIEGAKRYLDTLDALYAEKLKALKLKNLIPIVKGEVNGATTDAEQPTEPEGGLLPPGGDEGGSGVPALSVGAGGGVQPPLQGGHE